MINNSIALHKIESLELDMEIFNLRQQIWKIYAANCTKAAEKYIFYSISFKPNVPKLI